MSRIAEIGMAVERRPYLVLACVFLVSVFMAYGVTRLSMTTDFSKFIPEENPTIKTKLVFENEFSQVSYA
jgi:predicted RND superfamily exporter protein